MSIRSKITEIKRDLSLELQQGGDEMDHLTAFYTEGIELPEVLEIKRQRLVAIQSYMLSGHSQPQTAKWAAKHFGVTPALAYRLIAQAKQLMGDIHATEKEVLRVQLTHMWFRVAQKAKTLEQLDVMNRALENIAKYNGLGDGPGGATVNIQNVLMPASITYTSDPAALIHEIPE